jgi:hypothetical protein
MANGKKQNLEGADSSGLIEQIAQLLTEGAKTPLKSETKPQESQHFVQTSAMDYPTVYADGCVFATRIGSNVRIAFTETILEAADGPFPGYKARHVGTLVMPSEGFRDMMEYLNKIAPKFIFPEGDNG